ncbi:hypothetical protein KI387_038144, partial [Taxus chinensis]
VRVGVVLTLEDEDNSSLIGGCVRLVVGVTPKVIIGFGEGEDVGVGLGLDVVWVMGKGVCQVMIGDVEGMVIEVVVS